jgi:hypothetical protein
MQFLHQPLTWGFLIVLLPLLIHLINMMRHRRVHWAAMDFLLKAYKKHRKWIWLKQLLLLLMRMLAVAMIVAMLAQWISKNQLFSMMSGNVVHHYVVLDDSYSMSQQTGGSTSFDRAKLVIGQIVQQTQNDETGAVQKLTLLRTSRVPNEEIPSEDDLVDIADVNSEIIDGDFDVRLKEQRQKMESTELSGSPRGAIELLSQLVREETEEESILYVLSDFRNNEWENPAELKDALQELEDKKVRVELVNCRSKAQKNLAITSIIPADDTRAAGVPLFIEISVTNHGDEKVKDVQMKVRSLFYDPAFIDRREPTLLDAEVEDLPLEQIAEIEPGATKVVRVQVYFPKPGSHVVEAELVKDTNKDSVDADNRRWCVVECLAGERVLIVDGSDEQEHEYFLSSVFQPGKRANTGILPETKSIDFIRDATPDTLRAYSAIYLLDVPRLDEPAINRLEEYVKEGGGLAFFVGENTNKTHYTERLYQDGNGLFPMPIEGDGLLAEELLENTPDINATPHPIFTALLDERNPLIRLVSIERYLRPKPGWKPPQVGAIKVIATLRNGDPFVLEKQFGDGRILAFTTSISPKWNNWAQTPPFVVAILKTQSYLASSIRRDDPRRVGAPLEIQIDSTIQKADVTFIMPSPKRDRREQFDTSADGPADATALIGAIGNLPRDKVTDRKTDRSGVYEAWTFTKEDVLEIRRWAVNVDSHEGELAIVTEEDLLQKLDPLKAKIRLAEDYNYQASENSGFNRSMMLFCLLIPLLIGEQLLAFFASYHPPRGAAR